MLNRSLPALVIALLVAACATPAERAARMTAEVEEMILVYGPACEKLGNQPGTDAWRTCVLELNAQKARERYLASPRVPSCWGHRGFYNCP